MSFVRSAFAMALAAGVAATSPAQAGLLDGQAVNFYIGFWNSPPPAPVSVILNSSSGIADGSTISWGIYNELNVSGDLATVSINGGSSGGVYDVINFPDFLISSVSVHQTGVNRYGGTFGSDRVSFDTHNIFLNLARNWNVYDTRLVLQVEGVAAAPEPASLAILAFGLLATAGAVRRRS